MLKIHLLDVSIYSAQLGHSPPDWGHHHKAVHFKKWH